jgi:hypothetical protein
MKGRNIIFIVIGVILLCCVCCFAFFFTFGYFSDGEECIYEGPLAPDDACEELTDDLSGDDEDGTDEGDSDSNGGDDSDNSDSGDNESNGDSGAVIEPIAGWETYEAASYSIQYPAEWDQETEGLDTLILTPDGIDNFRLSQESNNQFTTLNSVTCEVFTESFMETYRTLFDEVSDPTFRYDRVAGNEACIIEDITVVTGGVEVRQEAYYIVDENDDSEAYTVVFSVSSGSGSNQVLQEFSDVLDTLSIN